MEIINKAVSQKDINDIEKSLPDFIEWWESQGLKIPEPNNDVIESCAFVFAAKGWHFSKIKIMKKAYLDGYNQGVKDSKELLL